MNRDREQDMGVLPKAGENSGRRWIALALVPAVVVGFLGSGAARSPAAIVTVLAALFVAVFIIALVSSMLIEPGPIEPELTEEVVGPNYSEASSVQHEAVYGSP